MPRTRTYARNRFERVTQVARWANAKFRIFEPGTVRIRWVDEIKLDERGAESLYGFVHEQPGNERAKKKAKLEIVMSRRGNPTKAQAIETILHELAHVMTWDRSTGYCHGPLFWKAFGRLSDAYHEQGGREASEGFPVN